MLWDLTGSEPNGEIVLKGQTPRAFLFDADSKLAAVAAGFNNGDLELWDTRRDQPKKRALPKTRWGIGSAAFSPDGHFLAYHSSEFKLQVLDIAGPQVKERALLDAEG
jgi:hypothetical protein